MDIPLLPKSILYSHYKEIHQIEWLVDMLIYAIDGKEL